MITDEHLLKYKKEEVPTQKNLDILFDKVREKFAFYLPYCYIHLHPFRYDAATTDPMEVARSDTQLFIVDAIISHTGTPKLKSNMTFKVKWQGYEGHPDEYQDLPWSELRTNSVLHDYLKTHGMATLVPIAFR